MNKFTEKFMERLQDMVKPGSTRNIKILKHSRNIKTPQKKKKKKLQKTQKQLNKLREDLEKLQSAKETIIKEIYEIKKTAHDMKEEFNKDIGNLRKKNETESLGIRSSFNKIKYMGKPIQKTRTSGRQNVKTCRQNRY
jgi:predicted  nucleic acid-binding Zn-ribbon protein